jgi:membrane protease YdiL (CAAX protease family)
MGRFGLRAGWGILIVAVAFFLLTILGGIFGVAASGHMKEIIAAQMQARANPGAPKPHVNIPFVPVLAIGQDGVAFVGLLAICWLFSRGERRPLSAYGIGPNRFKDVFPGALWGVVCLSLLVALLHSLHVLVFDGRNLYGRVIFLWGLKWLIAFLLVGFAEEYSFRGYVQFTLMRGLWGLAERFNPDNPRPLAFWLAATTLSLLFGAVHISNAGENFFGIIAVVLAGLAFSYTLWRTGSLWWGIGFHATWDWAQSFLFGVADSGNISVGRLFVTHPAGNPYLSGGPDGPEGSICVVLALALAVAAVHLTHPGPQPALEQGPDPRTLPPEPTPVIA